MSDKHTFSEGERQFCSLLYFIGLFVIEPLVLATLWRWYLVPMGLPTLSPLRAFGLNLIVGVLTYRHIPMDENERAKGAVVTFLGAPIALALGFIALRLFS